LGISLTLLHGGEIPPKPQFWGREFLTVGAVKRPILHQLTKFRKDPSNRYGDIAIFVIFKMSAAAILNFQNFNGRSAVGGQYASSCQISSNRSNGCRDMEDMAL